MSLAHPEQPEWMAGFSVETQVPLAPFLTIKAGGAADFFFQPQSVAELQEFFRKKPDDFPTLFLGAGSNLLVRDAGVAGVVVSLKNLTNVQVINRHGTGAEIDAEAGATCGKVARAARDEGLEGLSFLCGIPGSIGGALKMNAGCYGQETYNHVTHVVVLTPEGKIQTMTPAEVGFSYRHTNLPEGFFFLAATFCLQAGDKAEIKEKMKKINAERRESQPLEMPSSGSWFKNPVDPKTGDKINAWKVVEAAGCRGWQVGGAQVSEKHCNFFVNVGGATADDFEKLTQKVEEKIWSTQNLKMVREVRIVGRKEGEKNAEKSA